MGAGYLLKVVLGELVCDTQQLAAGVRVGEGSDAQAVGRVQLPLEELTAGLLDLCQLEKAGCGEERLHISLLHSHLGTRGQNVRSIHMYHHKAKDDSSL